MVNAIKLSISLPADMVKYLRVRAKQEDRPLSTVIRRAIEADIHAHAQAKARDADK